VLLLSRSRIYDPNRKWLEEIGISVHGLASVLDYVIPKLIGEGMSPSKIKSMFRGKVPDADLDALLSGASKGGARMKASRLSKY
jgi:hypothetical protein